LNRKLFLAALTLLAVSLLLPAIGSVVAKKDKTPATGSIVVNNGDTYTASTSVILTVTAYDPESGVGEVRYSNTGEWNTPWEQFSPNKEWTLTSGDGIKTVYYQIRNNDNVISEIYSDTIILDTPDDNEPLPTPSPNPTPTATPTSHPQPKPEPTPTTTPIPTPSPTPTPTASQPTPTPSPSIAPIPTPTQTPSPNPTNPPLPEPSPSPTPTIARDSTSTPTNTPDPSPSNQTPLDSDQQTKFSDDVGWKIIGVTIVLTNGFVLIYLINSKKRK
jgi:hypothetical protein